MRLPVGIMQASLEMVRSRIESAFPSEAKVIVQVIEALNPTANALRQRRHRAKPVTQTSVTSNASSHASEALPEPSCASRAASESLSSPKSSEILGAEENRDGEEKRVPERSPRNASVTPKVTPRSSAPSTAPTAATWTAYATAYRARYGADPLRNAAVNGQLARLLQRVPGDEAPHIAQHYVSSGNARYVAAGHTVGCLLQDAEKLRTEWLTGRSITAHEARATDRTSGRAQQYEQTFAQLRAEDRKASHG